MKRIAILGSTGSIGTQTLDVISKKEDLEVTGLAAGSNITMLEQQIRQFHPKLAAVGDEKKAQELRERVADTDCKILGGMEGLMEMAAMEASDILVTAIVGMIGIRPTIAGIQAGKDIALANKETLVTAGHIIMPMAKKYGVRILPVDSEHSAIFQALNGESSRAVHKLLITASGGPFRGRKREELENIQVEDALKHPNWSMGQKITIDSATLANKGLEVIEAVRLFDISADNIQVVVHPQSLIHSLVRTKDGMLYAQISDPDMKHPIFSALTWPENKETYLSPFDLFDSTMTFFRPRINDFPMLGYAFEAAKKSKSYTIAYNAANEEAVAAFLDKKTGFTAIPRIVRSVLDKDWTYEPRSFDDVFEQDKKARKLAQEMI